MENEDIVELIKRNIDVKENLGILYNRNLKFIRMKLAKYNNLYEMDDLLQESFFALREACYTYDMTRGYKFLTHFDWVLKSHIGSYLSEVSTIVRLPAHIRELLFKYKTIVNQSLLSGKTITDKELCTKLELSKKQLNNLKYCMAVGNFSSLDASILSEDGELSLQDCIAGDTNVENEATEKVYQEKLKNDIWGIVKKNVTEDENKIIKLRFENEFTFEQIGMELKINGFSVRTLENKALRKLRVPRISREIRAISEFNTSEHYRGCYRKFKEHGESVVEYMAMKRVEKDVLYNSRNRVEKS